MGQAVTTTNKSVALVEYFEDRKDQFAPLMEDAGQVDRFMRVMKNALIRDPKIAEASTQSVFLECQKCAADGLVLDGREAVLTNFKSKVRVKEGNKWVDKGWQTQVVYVPMIKGLTKLVSQSPQIADWHTGLVYEKEYEAGRFRYLAGDTPKLDHEPIIIGERGAVVAAYSVVRLRSGIVKIEVMTRGQLDGIKNRTKAKNAEGKVTGPWATDEEEMFRKTVARRHFKSLPLTEKLSSAFERVDVLYDHSAGPLDDTPALPQPKAVTNKKATSAKAKLAAAKPQPGPDQESDPQQGAKQEIDHDPETGEVLDGEVDAGSGFDADQDEF